MFFGKKHRNAGFTALEVVIATAILSILVIALIFVMRSGAASYSALTLQSQVQHDNRVALDKLREKITPAISFNPAESADLFVDVFMVTDGEFAAASDANGNGFRDAGEGYEDANNNGLYDGPTDALLVTLATSKREDPFVDENDDGLYNVGEAYTDLDGDGSWTDINGNGAFDPIFRTFPFPGPLAGEPDAYSIVVFAPYTTAEGHRQLRRYSLYRNEMDLDGDGVLDNMENVLETTGRAWDPPYTITSVNVEAITIADKSGVQTSISRENGAVDGADPYIPPEILCDNLRFLDFEVDIDARQQVMVNIQLAMLSNVESFNVNATGKGRVHSSITTGVWLNN